MKIRIIAVLAVGLVAGSCRENPVEVPETALPAGNVLPDAEALDDPALVLVSHSHEPASDGKFDLSKRTVKSALPPVPALPEDGPPIAEKVPGMSGYVVSPFAEGKKIEVVGYPRGTIVKCPYTSKEFRVP